MSASVKCDKCVWTERTPTFEDTLTWHGKACPACGFSPIVNDDEADMLNGLIALRKMGIVKMADDVDAKGMTVRIDTASARNDGTR